MKTAPSSRPGARSRGTITSLALLASVSIAAPALASDFPGPWSGPAVDLVVARSGDAPFRADARHHTGLETVVTDVRAADRTTRVRSELDGDRMIFHVANAAVDATTGAGDHVRLTIGDVPGGLVPATLQVLAGDGQPIGHVEVLGTGVYVTWFAGEAARRGDGVTIEFALAGAPVVPQRRMGEPVRGLTADELLRWADGRIDYNTPMTPEMGLGPIFNKENCGNCHNNPVGGTGTQKVTRFGFAGKDGFDPLNDLGGPLLQAGALDVGCLESIPAIANVTAQRVTNGMMGYGLVEALLDADIAANESSGPGVSGRAHIVQALEDPGVDRVGRFGWKAQLPTILSFSADAAMMEMGLSNRLIPFDNDPNGVDLPLLEDCDSVPDPEDFEDVNGRAFIDRVTDFQRFLAQPPQTPKSGMSGEAIFNAIGCVSCHANGFATPNDAGLEGALQGVTLRPYSDFLLHDMGFAADFIPDGDASDRELRTPPLWGLRKRPALWHDGRFIGGFESRVTAAIEEHGAILSEGADSATAWDGLSTGDKDAVLAFLGSLGRAEFDVDGDDLLLIIDFVDFAACYGSTGVTADDACAIHDLDQNGEIDDSDFAGFLSVYDGPFEDCNGNGLIDIQDIIEGTLPDADGDGIVDECPSACPGDLDGNGDVGFSDIVTVLGFFGSGDGGDVDGDGDTDLDDLIDVLATFGPCP